MSSRESLSELSSNETLNEEQPSSSSTACGSDVKPTRTLTTITDEHLITLEELCKRLNTRLDTDGLSRIQAKELLKNNGDNALEPPKRKIA